MSIVANRLAAAQLHQSKCRQQSSWLTLTIPGATVFSLRKRWTETFRRVARPENEAVRDRMAVRPDRHPTSV
ncbi:hypothetical protein EPK99_04740 [Neorhizobium lilium]|uniref:Uncharacterized protein n=1 Tax=Neorhizobium lilium TaxID=2503024 RepID=A0A3S3RQ02_9HYPH|nr:hypothetical protein [Neorhizobium lilium]RWX81590.1 hypothetical protein EPK99_04740 [Neorhizobium lilium]